MTSRLTFHPAVPVAADDWASIGVAYPTSGEIELVLGRGATREEAERDALRQAKRKLIEAEEN